jgi:hypothetical protein
MNFCDLQCIDFTRYDVESSVKKLKNEYKIDAPDSVVEQFYIDHSDKTKFQELYGSIDLHTIEWQLIEIVTSEIINIGRSATYPDYIIDVSEDASHYEEVGDSVIDCRKYVLEHWQKFGTWITPPIFIKGNVIGRSEVGLHLVEGHTRVGCLYGLTKYKIIDVAEKHQIYLGIFKSEAKTIE